MRKIILSSIALATLTTLLTGCGDQSSSVPTPEDAMKKEVVAIIEDELPQDATQIVFNARYGIQSCSVGFQDDEIGYIELNQPGNVIPILYTAKKDGRKWRTISNQYNEETLESSVGRQGSEAISASDFRARVRECVRLSRLRHDQLFSQSSRAKNALSWAQASEERNRYPSVPGVPRLLPALRANQTAIDQQLNPVPQLPASQ